MINVAIIGTGNIAPAHISAYLQFADRCRIVALCDIYPEKAEEKRNGYSLDGAKVYGDHEQMLQDTTLNIDVVSICTPPYTHAEIAVNCMRAGKHVIIEKPMAASLEECDRIREAEAETGVLVSSIAQNRFLHDVNRLKELVSSGIAGRILHARVDSHWWRGHNYYDLWWRGTWKMEGGGCTLNHAVHHIDMLLWLMGRPDSVMSTLANLAHDNAEVEDLSVSILHYPRSLATVTGSVIHHGEEQQIELQCERARIAWPFKVTASVARSNGFPEANTELEDAIKAQWDSIPDLPYQGHAAQIDDVLSCVAARIEGAGESVRPAIGSEDGRATVELITAIYKAGSTQSGVTLPIAEDDAWYTAQGVQEHAIHFYEKKTSSEQLGDGAITVGGS